MFFSKSICQILFLSLLNSSTGNYEDLLDTFINYVKIDARLYQVVLLLNDKNEHFHPIIQDTIKKIITNFPVKEISHSEATIEKAMNVGLTPSFLDPKISLFVVIFSLRDDKNYSKINKLIEFINKVSKHRSRPKCLVIILCHEKDFYKILLKKFWSKLFLDVTILEIVTSEVGKRSMFLNNPGEIAALYSFNPFNDTIKKVGFDDYSDHHYQQLNQDLETNFWFPDKLQNLYGYNINVVDINYPPKLYAISNNSRSVLPSFGPIIRKVEILSKYMNFSLNIFLHVTERKNISCYKNSSKGIFNSLRNNKVQLVIMEFVRMNPCDENLFEWSKGIGIIYVRVVVPLLIVESSKFSFKWKLSIIVFALPFFVWFLSCLFRFDIRNWRLIYIVQMMYGSSIPHEPRNGVERIFFIFILWAFFVQSSFINSVLTSLHVQSEKKFQFDSIDDVIKSNLQPIIEPVSYGLIYGTSDGSIKTLLDKVTEATYVTSEDCIDYLIKYQNVACFIPQSYLQMKLPNLKDKCGQPIAKMMDHYLISSLSHTLLEAGSPFVKRIDDFVQRITESGITLKWIKTQLDETTTKSGQNNSCIERQLETNHLIKHVFPLLAFGYFSSVIAFIGELLAVYILKLIHR